MSNDIVEKEKSEIVLSNHLLKTLGCKDCVWRSWGVCPKGLDLNSELKEGICQDMIEHITGLAKGCSSDSQIKEKFNLYVVDAQSRAELTEMSKLLQEYKLKLSGVNGGFRDITEKMQMEMKINMHKNWWFRLNESATKGHSKIGDREQKKDEGLVVTHKISLQQLHQIMNNPKVLDSEPLVFDNTKVIESEVIEDD